MKKKLLVTHTFKLLSLFLLPLLSSLPTCPSPLSPESLPAFIAQHTVEKLCLPCHLVLPKSGVSRRRPATMKEALVTGAGMYLYACVRACVRVCPWMESPHDLLHALCRYGEREREIVGGGWGGTGRRERRDGRKTGWGG